MTISDHGYIGYAVIVNKKFWEALPADIRGQLEGAMNEATKYSNAIAQEENDAALEAIRKSGKTTIYTLTPAEKAQWRQALLPVHKEMEGRIGKETLVAIEKAAAAK
jgi:C4-dicarboxylate-binding protein DctP